MSDLDKDRRTLEAIGSIYCRGHHPGVAKDTGGLCPACRGTIEQTLDRAAACPYGHGHNCEDCETHCQRGEAQQRIKAIMAYAAPRMVFRHPLMTLEYLKKKAKG